MIQWFAAKGGLAAVKGLVGKWWKLGAGAILGAALVFPVGQCSGAQNAKAKQAAAIAQADAREQAKNSKLLEAASRERAADTAKITEEAKGRSNAIRAGEDAPTSGPECRLNRRRLLDAGFREADLPKCG